MARPPQSAWLAALALVACGQPIADDAEPGDTAGDLPYARATTVVQPRVAAPSPAKSDDASPTATLVDEADARGLTRGQPSYGRGTSLVDIDNDGWVDIWQSHASDFYESDHLPYLWHNLGDGTFKRIPMPFQEPKLRGNWGGLWADFDEDGDQDLFTISGGYNGAGRLGFFRNDLPDNGRFTEVTTEVGISRLVRRWWSASEADFDRDGDLDVVVVGTADSILAPCCAAQISPLAFVPSVISPVQLYVNDGTGHFTEVAGELGLEAGLDDGKNAVWWDYNADGWPDLFIANMAGYSDDQVQKYGVADPQLYRNDEGKGFTNVTLDVLNTEALRAPSFGAAVADVNQDGFDDLVVARNIFQDEVYLSRGDGTLEVRGGDYGLDAKQGWGSGENSMGMAVGDLNGDGYPEYLVGPGWPSFTGTGIVYQHTGTEAGFQRMTTQGVKAGWYHGAATGDIDNDGDDDLFWNLGGFAPVDTAEDFWGPILGVTGTLDTRQHPLMLINHADVGHTVSLRLEGTVSNRDAVGAHVTVLGERPIYAQVPYAQGFASQNSRVLTLSLGEREEALVEVAWPSGLITRNLVHAGTRTRLIEPTTR